MERWKIDSMEFDPNRDCCKVSQIPNSYRFLVCEKYSLKYFLYSYVIIILDFHVV